MLQPPNIVHFITPFLFHTGSWVYSQLKGIKDFNSYVFTQMRQNSSQFPYDKVINIEDFSDTANIINKYYVKYTDNYGLFYNKYLNEIKPVLLHAHFGFEAARWYKFIKKSNLPLITTFYGLDVSQLGKIDKWRNRYKPLFDYGSFFLAEGNYLKKQLIKIGCPEEKVLIQRIGVAVDKYPVKDYSQKNDGKITIIQVSSFREKKGIIYSLKAIAELKKIKDNFNFILAGKGDTTQADNNIKSIVSELGISDIVELTGAMPHADVLNKISECDIFLHPSVEAQDGDNEGGSPVIVTEASAIGLPIVSTYHCDIPEVVINNKTGLLVKEKDVDAIVEKCLLLLNNYELRKNFGLEGKKHIEENYNISKQIIKLEEIYHRTLK